MNEQVLTMTASALEASFVISTPSLSNEPSIISACTRFLAQPRERIPTRRGRPLAYTSFTGRRNYAMRPRPRNHGKVPTGVHLPPERRREIFARHFDHLLFELRLSDEFAQFLLIRRAVHRQFNCLTEERGVDHRVGEFD